MTYQNKVSIIIPTYNNEDTIGLCLSSIHDQIYSPIETIVVDGGSDDSTVEICNSYGVKTIKTTLGRSEARLTGARESTGDYIFHVDSDMELNPEVVGECISYIQKYDALIIPEVNIGGTYWAKCTDVGKELSRAKETGNLRFLSRGLYIDVGGHNPNLLGKEDKELHDVVVSEGASVGHTDTPILHHVGEQSIFDILSQRFRYIRSFPDYYESARVKNGPTIKPETSTSEVLLRELIERPKLMPGFVLLAIATRALTTSCYIYWKLS